MDTDRHKPIPQCGKKATQPTPPRRPTGHVRALGSSTEQRARGPVPTRTEGPKTPGILEIDAKLKREQKKAQVLPRYHELMNSATRQYFGRVKVHMATFTYRNANGRQDAPYEAGQIARLTRNLGRHFDRLGIELRLVWVAELGKRKGRLHYHAVIIMPIGQPIRRELLESLWGLGQVQIKKHDDAMGTNPAAYLAKYISKAATDQHGKTYPRHCRVCGAVGLTQQAKDRLNWQSLPVHIKNETTPADRVMRVEGGGRTSRRTGRHWPALYMFAYWNGRPCIVLKTHPLAAQLAEQHSTVRTHAPKLGTLRISGGPTLSAPYALPCTPDHHTPTALQP